MTPNQTCKHCGKPIRYSVDDVVYLHVNREWGEDWSPCAVERRTYNNRFYCDASRTTAAEPADILVA